MRINAARKAGWSARSQTAARSAAHRLLDLLIDIATGASSTYSHGVTGSAGMTCTGSSNCSQKRADRLGWRVTTAFTASHRRSRVKRAGHGDIQLHCVHIAIVAVRGAGVEQQSLLHRGQRQDIGDPVLLLQLVNLGLAEPGGRDIGRCQSAPTSAHMRAYAGQGVKPQPAQPIDLRAIQRRGCPGPVGVQIRAGVRIDGAGVELHGVRQRHSHRSGGTDKDKSSWRIRHS